MDETIYEASPSMRGSHPTRFLIVLALCFVGVGIPVLLFWWLYVRGQRLIITETSLIYRKGIFFTSTSEVLYRNVRKVQVSQSSLQRKFRAGNITISGQDGMEIAIKGIAVPEHVKAIIDMQREVVSQRPSQQHM